MSMKLKMPFYKLQSWKNAGKEDLDLKRCYAQLSAGTRLGKKEKIYLQVAVISDSGLLVHRKSNPYGRDYGQIIVQSSLAPDIISSPVT